ncbi:MAG: hypothetical protein IMZ59_05095 [Actinobacteria bacterium]|nr:hypothetical protein [Actinomycetota bacterium]
MNLELTEINYKLGYVSVKDKDTGKAYFTQGEEAQNDIDIIEEHGETVFLNYLIGSGYFDRE